MTTTELNLLTEKLHKLFPKNPEVNFIYQHVYGLTFAQMRFVASFDVTNIRAAQIKAGLVELRDRLDSMIESIPGDPEDVR